MIVVSFFLPRQAGGNQAAAKDAAAREFDEGSFSQNIALWIEHNEQTGELEMYLKFRKGYLKPGPYANGRSGDWFAQKIIDRINRKLSQSSWDRPLLQKQEIAGGSDGRYRSEELNVFEWAAFGMEELGYVVNHAEMNVHLWNDIDDNAAYNKSVLNIWAPVAGGGDQALAEVKDLYELVEFTGDIIEDPALVKDLYNSVASLSYEDIKGMVQQGLEDKKAQYQKGGTVRQYHTTRDGIQAVILVAGAVKGVPALIKKGGSWIKQFKQLVKDIPHADVQAKVKNLDQVLAKKFVEAFDGVDNKLKELLKANSKVFDAWERVAKANLPDLTIKHKKFPEREGSWVLQEAKKYQAKFSGDADLSFDYKGVSFDDFKDGVLVDAKFGHGKSVFNDIDGDFDMIELEDLIRNEDRVNSIIKQAQRQLGAIKGTNLKVQWRISSELGQKGIQKIFEVNNIDIEVIFERL